MTEQDFSVKITSLGFYLPLHTEHTLTRYNSTSHGFGYNIHNLVNKDLLETK